MESPGSRQLPVHHISIRVPWHDGGWNGTVCKSPQANTSCLVLPRIGEGRHDETESRCCGQKFNSLSKDDLPPCVGERASFMAPFELRRKMTHPYAEIFPATHGHFLETEFVHAPYSAACVPFRWMLRENVEGNSKEHIVGLAEELRLGWDPDREPEIRNIGGKEVDTDWVQEQDNQLALLDTFFSAIRPEESLCFFYAKRTPLSDQARRVIVGVGRVVGVGKPTEYLTKQKNPALRCALWERNIHHSIRPGFKDGFLFPYAEVLALANKEGLNPEQFIAFAPKESFEQYSYGSELLNHDDAIASLVACSAAMHRIKEKIEGPWNSVLAWVDSQINKLWCARGPYPGLGSALSAFGYEWGFQHGTLVAYEIELIRQRDGIADAWQVVNEVMTNPSRLASPLSKLITNGLRSGWKSLTGKHRELLCLLSRCAISEDQALRIYDKTKRAEAGINATDDELLKDPYLLFEVDRRAVNPIPFGAVDRGLLPDESIRKEFPLSEPSGLDDPADPRRVRALVVDILENAASEGHTLLPQSWIIKNARDRSLQPPCPLGENVLSASEDYFGGMIHKTSTSKSEVAYQVDRFVEVRSIIRSAVLDRIKGKPHSGNHNWREAIDNGINQPLPENSEERELEEKARVEKAAALEQLFCSRISVLIGSAGTGKTTLLRMLCSLPDVLSGGIVLLAPTGKARVRLEQQTNLPGHGKTLAQFLSKLQRYNPETGAYFPNKKAQRCADFRTVIIDEASMLTEDQLSALIDGTTNVGRLILVGDPRQLPPIGPGRPFVDIVSRLTPVDCEATFPRCRAGYAELTIPRRHKGSELFDILLADHFSGRPLEPGADLVWDVLNGWNAKRLKTVQWSNPDDLNSKLMGELKLALNLSDSDDELGFEESLGGSRFGQIPWAFFWNQTPDRPGAAAKAEAWQVLSPIRATLTGVDAVNRTIQKCFRGKVRELSTADGWGRKFPRPVGPQGLLYGDKVINVINKKRRDVYPKPENEAFIANGDIGMVVGQYKTKSFKGLPWKIEIEFAGQLGLKYGFHSGEFGEGGDNPLELAYCLTVHKTQGSEFGTSFLILNNPCWLLSRELL